MEGINRVVCLVALGSAGSQLVKQGWQAGNCGLRLASKNPLVSAKVGGQVP